MVPDNAEFDVIVEDERWTSALGDVAAFADECRAATRARVAAVGGGAALLFADDATLRDLNHRYRGFDKPTNVLSFPAIGADGSGATFMGDIAFAYETCAREAEEQGVAFRDHAAHLIVHGLLHLAGFDHEADDDAERMESLETEILARLGVGDPYAAPRAAPIDGGGR